ncbi:uncharacterized protein LOC130533394 [Takifugu flavidus]|uniref:uncharacterized protein LOC130533394 n=1 Tax=Takifugu flavidus TaxID=433684 RepID=UPI0025440EC7|nr:uncharacterized protein LOC130533394 [Takifugu flavidus]
MAIMFSTSQVLLLSLLCWNVLCYPVKTGWIPQESNMGGAAKMAFSAPHVSSWFPPPPTDPDHPAISFLHDPDPTGVLSNSNSNIDNPSWWNPVLSFDVVRNSATPDSASKTSHYSVTVLPPPPPYIPREFEAYVGNLKHGNSEMEAEEQMFSSFGPSPQPVFQAGELSEYESILEYGHEKRETEEEVFMPHYSFPSQGFWELPVVFNSASPMHSSSQWLQANLKYPFSGPVAPRMLSHFHSMYDGFYYPKD